MIKKIKCSVLKIFTLIFGLSLSAQNSVPIPYLQPFDSYIYDEQPAYSGLEVVPYDYVGNECPEPEDVESAYGYSWSLSQRSDPAKGKAMKLTVHPEDHPCKADAPRDRAEMIYNLPTLNETSTYIRWNFYIPNNSEFEDEEIHYFPAPREYEMHKIFQLKANTNNPENNNTPYTYPAITPILGMSYVHKNDTTTLKRDLYILIESPNIVGCDSTSVREGTHRMTIIDAFKKGEWNEIMYKFNFSRYDSLGYFQVWINKNPVVIDDSQTNQYWNTYFANVIPPLGFVQQPSKIYCANVYSDDNTQPFVTGIPMANNIKFGHYRRNHTKDHSLYLDNLQVTNSDPRIEQLIKLTTQYCNQPIDISNQTIECESVSNATNYKFRFEHNGEYNWVDSSTPSINLLDHSFLDPGITYNVQVRAQKLTSPMFDYNYGEICTITTASHTKLRGADCNNLNSEEFYDEISALKVHNANNYKFRFTRIGEPERYYDSSTPFMTPAALQSQGLTFNKTYTVHVRATGPNFDFDYGDGCLIKFISTTAEKTNNSSSIDNHLPEPIIYPNPVNHILNIENFTHEKFSYEVYNQLGGVVLKSENFVGNQINMEKLSQGMYFLKLRNSQNTFVYKILKK